MANYPLCTALYEYQARDGEELTISKNETLTVVDGQGSWWTVKNDRGQQGIVPSNYVRMNPKPVQLPAQQSSPSNRTTLKQDGPAMYQQPDLIERSNGPSLNIKAVAKFSYDGKQEDELSLRKGDNVIVMEKEADGWWRGRSGTRIGWFPFNYVEEISEEFTPQPELESSSAKSFICGVIALYSFNSGNPEELPFEKGDLMDIIDQPTDDPDWWQARKADGLIGLVPRNYVEVVHDAEPVFGRPQGHESFASRGGPPASGNVSMSSVGMAGVRVQPSFVSEVWFHGKMSRRDAENILNSQAENGQFIVRESETKVRANGQN